MSENKTYPVFENIARKSHIQKKKLRADVSSLH